MPHRRFSLFDLIGVLAICAMIASLFFLVRRYEAGFGELDLEITQQELEEGFREGFEYHGLYSGETKVGTLRTERRKRDGGYSITTEMNVVFESSFVKTTSSSRLVANLDESFKLDSFELNLKGAPLSLEVSGFWNGEAMIVDGLPGESGPVSYELPEAPFILPSLRPILMRRNLTTGDRLTLSYFNPMTQEPVSTDITFVGREDIELMGKTVEAFHFEEIAMGHRNQVWVNALGEVLIEQLPMGFLAIREPETEAKFGVEAANTIGPPALQEPALERPEWLRMTVIVKAHPALEKSGNDLLQVVEPTPGGLGIEVEAVPKLPATLPDELGPGDLGPSASLPVGAASLVTIADSLPSPEDLPLLVEAVFKSTHEALNYQPGFNVGVLDGLELGRGDSSTFSRLATTLFRAKGVPARVAYGLLVVDRERVLKHHWVEIRVGQWVPLDPTLEQAPADAGRLRLGYGTETTFSKKINPVEIVELNGEKR